MKLFSSCLPFWLFIFFVVGIVLGNLFLKTYGDTSLHFWLFAGLAAAAIAGVVWFYRRQRLVLSDIFIVLTVICLGAVWVIPSIQQTRAIDNYVTNGRDSSLHIKIVSIPQEMSTRNTCYAVIRAHGNVPLQKKIRVMDYTRQLQYLHSYTVDGNISRRNYQGRPFYTLWVKKNVGAQRAVPLPLPFWDKYAMATTNYIMTVFKNNLSDQGYRFMSSVLLGRRELLGQERQLLADAGAAHLLALSGLHLGLISVLLFFILRLFYLPFKQCLAVSVLFLLVYTFLTGAAWSTLRAALMYSFFAGSFFIKRRVNLLNSLGLAGLVTIAINPLALFEAGFQLSYLAVFALIIWFKIFPMKVFKNRFANYIQGLLLCSFSVTIFLAPLISYYFGRIYVFSIFYNLILIPVFTLLLSSGFLLIIFSPLIFIAQSVGGILSWGIWGFVHLSRIFGSFGLAYFEYRLPFFMAVIYYFILAAGLTAAWRHREAKTVYA